MGDGGNFLGTVAKSAVRGAASGGGLVSAPFKAVQAGGNAISGIQKNLYNFDKAQARKSRFKKKVG